MPRALRLESENASYHVINRGNYRAPIFRTDGAKQAFLRCLDETCLKTGRQKVSGCGVWGSLPR